MGFLKSYVTSIFNTGVKSGNLALSTKQLLCWWIRQVQRPSWVTAALNVVGFLWEHYRHFSLDWRGSHLKSSCLNLTVDQHVAAGKREAAP